MFSELSRHESSALFVGFLLAIVVIFLCVYHVRTKKAGDEDKFSSMLIRTLPLVFLLLLAFLYHLGKIWF